MRRLVPLLALLAALPSLGCSGLAARLAAGALTSGGDAYARDDDPELVRGAVPFGLKTMEGVLADDPENEELLLALASGFTQYAFAFVAADAEAADLDGRLAEARAGRDRARRLLLRARDYGLRALDGRHEGLALALREGKDVGRALRRADDEDDVPYLYWAASAWALAISNGKGDMSLVAELPVPVAMMRRALALDERWGEGALHEFFLAYLAGRSEAEGGGRAVLEGHYRRALELSMKKKLGPHVAWAEGVLVAAQDRAAFTALLQEVLAADPGAEPRHRLANVLAQRRARLLLDHVDDLFL